MMDRMTTFIHIDGTANVWCDLLTRWGAPTMSLRSTDTILEARIAMDNGPLAPQDDGTLTKSADVTRSAAIIKLAPSWPPTKLAPGESSGHDMNVTGLLIEPTKEEFPT